ncbi:hypothetical protein AWC26_12200 [Mycobacterium shimoidei]|jgi:hypothetical protein|nr:hypothetical protein BHQ16_19395 [Mycobacterium shimoidei]ORW80622.1 hypothetical protein AWC26_12200 [Mycobacterium shimoidei]
MVPAVPAQQRSHCTPGRRDTAAQLGNRRRRATHTGIEKTMMSTVLGMLMMMPVVFGFGGYVLVSRRP